CRWWFWLGRSQHVEPIDRGPRARRAAAPGASDLERERVLARHELAERQEQRAGLGGRRVRVERQVLPERVAVQRYADDPAGGPPLADHLDAGPAEGDDRLRSRLRGTHGRAPAVLPG